MDAIKHAAASMKEKLTGHHGHHAHERAPTAADKAPPESNAAVPTAAHSPAAQSEPATHGHEHSPLDLPGAPGIIETPAPGVAGTGTAMPGLAPSMLPRI